MLSKMFSLGAGVIAASLALAQDAVFLVPRTFVLSQPKAEVTLSLGVKQDRPAVPGTNLAVRWAFVKTGRVQENRDGIADWLTTDGRIEPVVPSAGGVMIGADFVPVVEAYSTTDVTRIFGRPVVAPTGTVNVRHYRSAIALLKTAWGGIQDGEGPQVPTSETSLTCNIHAILDPTRPTLGGDLAFEAAVRGTDLEGVKLMVVDETAGTTTILRTGEGSCHFKPTSVGQYRIYFQYLRPVKGDAEAQFELYSGTMTFSIPSVKEVKS